ncbi:MAG: MFS transporter, partial [Acidimicrobiia bacterium]|nr:MFS transporter [Acidimicrobiia bacterium]
MGTIIAMLPSFLTAALVVQIGLDIGLTLTGLGVLIALFFGMAALVSPTAGRLSERVGWANALRIAALLSALALGAIGWIGDSAVVLGISLGLAGVASSLTQTAANLTIARCVVPSLHGWVFGIKHACVPAAMFLAGLAVPTIALTVGWRWAFRAASILAVLAAAF